MSGKVSFVTGFNFQERKMKGVGWVGLFGREISDDPYSPAPRHDRFCRSIDRVNASYFYAHISLCLSVSLYLSFSLYLWFLLSGGFVPLLRPLFYAFSICRLICSFGMGRVKLKIKRLENTNGRQATYAKRKHGIMKKANELSILCDIDIVLLMFSPTGKPSLCSGKHSSIDEVIEKFAQLTPQERAKRKLESLEALKKTFKKLDHDVNIQEFLGMSNRTVEDLTNQEKLLQTQLSEVHRRLSYWSNPEKINSVETLGQMENSLRESLNQIRAHKENLGKQQLISLECTNQIQNGIHLSFGMGAEQQLQPLSWIPTDESKNIALPEDQNLLPHRDVECTASSSFGSYSGYFSMGKSSEISNSGQESGILNELSGTASLRLQVNGQYPYLPYNLNFLNDTKFQQLAEMNLQENPVDYHVNGILEAPMPGYDTTQGSWASTSGPCAVTMFDEQLFSLQPN